MLVHRAVADKVIADKVVADKVIARGDIPDSLLVAADILAARATTVPVVASYLVARDLVEDIVAYTPAVVMARVTVADLMKDLEDIPSGPFSLHLIFLTGILHRCHAHIPKKI